MATAVAARLVLVVLLGVLATAPPAHAQSSVGPAYVTRVVDGDKLYAEIGGRLEIVRYLGINTPRIEHPAHGFEPYAEVAREVNRRLVEGRWIRLVFDGPPRDQHGRLVAYVWRDNVFVNAVLAHYGYAEAATGSRAGYATYFRQLEEGARQAGRGIWADPQAAAYHRPRATEAAADTPEGEAPETTVTSGRVFSAPAPFIPSSPTTGSGGPSAGVPTGPAPTTSGSPSYIAPPRSIRTTR